MASQRAKGVMVFGVAGAATLSLVAIVVASIRIEVHSPTAGVIVVSARGMAELFAGLLAAQRFSRSGLRLDFGIALALGTMAMADLVFALGRATLSGSEVSPVAVMPYHLVGAGLLVTAAFSGNRALAPRRRRQAVVAGVGAVAVGLLVLQGAHLLPGARVIASPQASVLVVMRIGTAALLGAAAAGLLRRARAEADPLVTWLAVAAALSGLAQLHRVLVPATAAATTFSWAHVLQIVGIAALLAGVVEETRGYQRRLAELAVADERRRIARDMHDGVAQDVAYISSQSRDLARESDDHRLQLIAEAAQRALEDSRFIIKALTRASAQPLGASIALQAQEFARRWGLAVDVSVAEDLDVPPE
jgi:signal transduction histidine kinase